MKINFAFVTFLLLLTKCAVIKPTNRDDLVKLDKDNLAKLNSFYSNCSNDSINYIDQKSTSLWYQISARTYDKMKKDDWKSQTVKLTVLNQKKISFELFSGDSLIKQKTIRGKLKEGYFYKRPFFLVIPFIPIIYGYRTNRYRFGLSEDNLIIDYKNHFYGIIILGGNAENYQRTLVFKKSI